MLGKEPIALEVRSRKLLLELPDVLDQVVEALTFVGWAGKDDVVGHTLLKEVLPLRDGDVGPGGLIGVPELLKSVDCHMQPFLEDLFPAFSNDRRKWLYGR